jgi:hypothetical protein
MNFSKKYHYLVDMRGLQIEGHSKIEGIFLLSKKLRKTLFHLNQKQKLKKLQSKNLGNEKQDQNA